MKAPKIGIIVPVGNSESFIEKFITNYINTIDKYDGIIETIFVCNNSTEKCIEIIKHFEDPHLHVYDLGICTNGISKSRNYGLKMLSADVEFVGFLDDDDSLSETCLKNLSASLKTCADIICFEWSEIQNEDGAIVRRSLPRHTIEKTSFVIKQDLSKYLILPKDRRYLGYCWAKLYRKTLLDQNNILFDENLSTFEDVLFLIEAIKSAAKIQFSDLNFLTQNFIFKTKSEKASYSYLDFEKSLGFCSVANYIKHSSKLSVSLENFEKKHLLARYTGYLFYFSVLRNYQERNDTKWWLFAIQARKLYEKLLTEFTQSNYFVVAKSGESKIIGELHRRGFIFLAVLISIYKASKGKNK